jgi:hypothetical protein
MPPVKDTNVPKQVDTVSLLHDRLKIISDSTNTLTGKIESLELEYVVWGCACAPWITVSDRTKYGVGVERCIFIEPADSSLQLPLYFDASRHTIQLKGQFYARPDYPKGTVETEESLQRAKVFHYTELKIRADRYTRAGNDTTIMLRYNAIACTCAQWSFVENRKQTHKGDYIYLERATEALINADILWHGNNLPLHVKLKGRFVSEHGFPTGFNPAKGTPKRQGFQV